MKVLVANSIGKAVHCTLKFKSFALISFPNLNSYSLCSYSLCSYFLCFHSLCSHTWLLGTMSQAAEKSTKMDLWVWRAPGGAGIFHRNGVGVEKSVLSLVESSLETHEKQILSPGCAESFVGMSRTSRGVYLSETKVPFGKLAFEPGSHALLNLGPKTAGFRHFGLVRIKERVLRGLDVNSTFLLLVLMPIGLLGGFWGQKRGS